MTLTPYLIRFGDQAGFSQGVLDFMKMKISAWLLLFVASSLRAETLEIIRKIPHTG